jgi:predicted transcriptional regulator
MPDDAQTGLERDTAEIASRLTSGIISFRRIKLRPDSVGSQHAQQSWEADRGRGRSSPAVPIRRSVHRDYVVCLECGWRGKMLRRHIGTLHDLGPGEYRRRWGLSADHPLTAPGYSEARSGLAKQLGLGRRGRDGDTEASPEPARQPQPEKPPSRRGRRQTSEQQSD